MYLLNETLSTPEENLAMDEALVEVSDRRSLEESTTDKPAFDSGSTNEVLRLWELRKPCVVLGRASKWQEEVDSIACQRDNVPVLRRASGGASIVAGPGCLMYSLLISYQHRPAWRALDIAHKEVMSRTRDAVQKTTDSFRIKTRVIIDGICDLTIDGRKFSGNALRCTRNWMLYHGTIMYAMPLEWLSEYLHEPSRQPEYRQKREHLTFVTNVLDNSSHVAALEFRQELEHQLTNTWNATQSWQSSTWKREADLEAAKLLKDRYTNLEWHQSR